MILDDVMTAGTAVRQSIDLVKAQGGKIVGIVLALGSGRSRGRHRPRARCAKHGRRSREVFGRGSPSAFDAAHARVNVLARREGEVRGSGEHECVPSSLWY